MRVEYPPYLLYRINCARGIGHIDASFGCSMDINTVVSSSVAADELDTSSLVSARKNRTIGRDKRESNSLLPFWKMVDEFFVKKANIL